jgi:hypothetical protein
MSQIHERLTVLCPFDQIARAAGVYVASLPVRDGKAVVALRVTVGDLVVERHADLTLEPGREDPGFHIMTIGWRPHDGGLYPRFAGTLSVEDMNGNYCRLDLNGSYVPPLGVAGAVFDVVAGHRMAEEAARALLDEIGIGLELAFQTGATVEAAF